MTDHMNIMRDELGAPRVVDRNTFQAELGALRVREKAHTTGQLSWRSVAAIRPVKPSCF
jgi:hypothetical protein